VEADFRSELCLPALEEITPQVKKYIVMLRKPLLSRWTQYIAARSYNYHQLAPPQASWTCNSYAFW